MNTKQKLIFFALLILVHWSLIFLISFFFLLSGIEDLSATFVIIYGIANTIFTYKFLKNDFLTSLVLGFLISGLSLFCSYLVNYIEYPINGMILFLGFSLLFWILTLFINWKNKNLKRTGLLVVLAIILLILSFKLPKLNENNLLKTEPQNMTEIQIKVLDKENHPSIGDSIEIRIEVQPLFSMRGSREINKTITDENGISKIRVSKINNYQLFINSKNIEGLDGLIFLDIDSTDLKTKKEFVVKYR